MTNDELEAVRARVLAATAGPWTFREQKGTSVGGFDAPGTTVCSFGYDDTYYPTEGTPPETADAAFIAHARTDIPALLDALTRAEAHAERLAAVMAEFIAAEDSLIAELVAVGETVDSCSAPFPLVAKMRQALSAYRGGDEG